MTDITQKDNGGVWRPIKTAPKDGTEFLALNYDGLILHCDTAYVSSLGTNFYSVKGSPSHCSPTHWMPLPEPPARKEGDT